MAIRDPLATGLWLSRSIDSIFADVKPITVRPVEMRSIDIANHHERTTTGVDRRHWTEKTVIDTGDDT